VTPNWETIGFFAEAATTLINGLCAVYVWQARRMLASRNEMTALDRRVALIEKDNESRPGWGALRNISDRLGEIEGDVKALRATLDAHVDSVIHLRASIESIQQFLLEGKKPR
jgi:hypothetical protein